MSEQAQGLVFCGESAAVRRLRVQVGRIAPHFRTALIVGEAGAGKGEVARELHRLSPVRGGEFRVGVDDRPGGTVYVRDVCGLGLAEQDSLLAALREVDRGARVVFGAEGDLRGMLAAGRLRAELLDRMGGLEIRVCGLRERVEDLAAMMAGVALEEGVMARMMEYGWPGNLAELRGVMAAGVVRMGDVPCGRVESGVGETRLEVVMRRHVADVLEQCSGNKLRASEMLGISRSTLYRMLDSLAG